MNKEIPITEERITTGLDKLHTCRLTLRFRPFSLIWMIREMMLESQLRSEVQRCPNGMQIVDVWLQNQEQDATNRRSPEDLVWLTKRQRG